MDRQDREARSEGDCCEPGLPVATRRSCEIVQKSEVNPTSLPNTTTRKLGTTMPKKKSEP